MELWSYLLLLQFLLYVNISLAAPVQSTTENEVETTAQAFDYLTKYGYNTCENTSKMACSVDVSSLLKNFQKFHGLEETGTLDVATKQLMSKPRCGNPDVKRISASNAFSKWSKNSLTWSLRGNPNELSIAKTESIMQWAFQHWTDHIPIKIKQTCSTCNADIVIDFLYGNHGDMDPFDGPGRVLAHAFFPEDGRIHFDKAEKWNEGFADSNSLYLVAVHEIGHALGFDHQSSHESIMYPTSRAMASNKVLPSVDRKVAQNIYGHQFPSILKEGQRLSMSEQLRAPNGDYTLIMQADGNLVIYKYYSSSSKQAIWSSGTNGRGISPYYATLGSDGNFAVYDGNADKLWETGTKENKEYTHLIMQDDGNLVLYKNSRAPESMWATNTQQKPDMGCKISSDSSYAQTCTECSKSSNGCIYKCHCHTINGSLISTSITLSSDTANICTLHNNNGHLWCVKSNTSTTYTTTSAPTTLKTTVVPEDTTSAKYIVASFQKAFPNDTFVAYKYKTGGAGYFHGTKLLELKLNDEYWLRIFKLSQSAGESMTTDQIKLIATPLILKTKAETDDAKRRDILYNELKSAFPNHYVNIFIYNDNYWSRSAYNGKGYAYYEKNYGSEVDIVLS